MSRTLGAAQVLLAGLLLCTATRAAADETLGPGERRTVTLGPSDPGPEGLAASRLFLCTPAADGPLTVTAESCAGDALLRLLDADGRTLAEDDNGLVETNARLVVAGRAGQVLHLLAGLRSGAGALTVAVATGEVPPPQGVDLVVARAEFRLGRVDSGAPLGENPNTACDLLISAGNMFFNARLYARAKEPLTRAAALAAAHSDPLRSLQAQCFLACIERQIGDAATAATLLTAAVADAVAQKQPKLEMLVRSNLGPALLDLARFDEAQACLQRSLELAQAAGDKPNEAVVTSLLGLAAERRSRPDEARALNLRAIDLARGTGQSELVANMLLRQGSFLAARGECLAADAPLREALSLAQASTTRGRVIGALADVERALSDRSAALKHYQDAAALGRQLGDPLLQARASTGIGMLHRELGQLDEAEAALREALALFPATGAAAERTLARLQLAFVIGESGDSAGELTLCEQALSEAGAAGDASARVASLRALAIHHAQTGDMTKALAFATEQESVAREAGAAAALGDALGEQAYLKLRLGSPADARHLASAALDALRPLQSPESLLGPLSTVAQAALAQGEEPAAAAALAEAESIYDRPDLGLDPERLSGIRRASSVAACGELAQDLAVLHWQRAKTDGERRRAADEGLRVAGRWKGRALLEGLLLRSDAPADALGELLAGADGRLQPKDTGSALGRADELLAPGDALLEYVEGRERLYAWSVHDGAATLHDLGPRAPLAARVADFVRGIGDPSALASVQRVASEGRALHDALLAGPLAGVAPEARLFIVPCPALAPLPFEALVVQAAATPRGFQDLSFVLDRREVVYAPSTPVLELLAQSGPRAKPGRALVLGDPAYPLPVAGAVPRGPRDARAAGLQRLPGTRDEALGVARLLAALLPEPAPLAAPAGDDLVLDTPQFRLCLGGGAAPGALRDEPRQYALIHCASHGWMDARDPRRTGLALSPSGEDDGFLSVADVLRLQLDADLAVLSACETSRGGERRGEGTQSLARAFLYAGSRAVISSLWQVDDRETQQLMQDLYAGLGTRGLTASQALREARLALRRSPAAPEAFRGVGRGLLLAQPAAPARPELAGHPFFWAAFVYVGPAEARPLAALAPPATAPTAGR